MTCRFDLVGRRLTPISASIALFLVFGWSCGSAADEFSGTLLEGMCASDNTKDICENWIAGFADGLFASRVAAETGRSACLPNGFTGYQANKIVKKFIAENPQLLQEPARAIVFIALSHAFPCR
jgi:Rap1a immunity proteins